MRRGKGIVDVDIAQRTQALRQVIGIGLFALQKTDILQHYHLMGIQVDPGLPVSDKRDGDLQ